MPNSPLGYDDSQPWGEPHPVTKPANLPDHIKNFIDRQDERFYKLKGPTQDKEGDKDKYMLLYDYILREVIDEWRKGLYDKGGAAQGSKVDESVESLMTAWGDASLFQITNDQEGATRLYRMNKRKEYVRVFLPTYKTKILKDLENHIKAHQGGI
ncbi:MAG: hypothetical protein LQ343_000699 [Gyalolechia ehrenbergii]|nr:MAG: hypothetical protein LQ343_000699 [Gyalolechia ehrenbergii]